MFIFTQSSFMEKAIINDYSNFDNESLRRASVFSPAIENVTAEIALLQNVSELQQTDFSTAKEFLAEYIESRSTIGQVVDIMKTGYRAPDIFVLMLPVTIYEDLGIFINVTRLMFLILLIMTLYLGIRSGSNVVNS